MGKKRLRVFAGPNGSGKSSLYSYLTAQGYFNPYFYINADEIVTKLYSGYSVLNWPITVKKGGHSVEEAKITSRYQKTMDNLFLAIKNSDKAFIFDNSESEEDKMFRNFANYDRSKEKLKILQDTVPSWFNEYVINKINK